MQDGGLGPFRGQVATMTAGPQVSRSTVGIQAEGKGRRVELAHQPQAHFTCWQVLRVPSMLQAVRTNLHTRHE